jgi:hypothetical protein
MEMWSFVEAHNSFYAKMLDQWNKAESGQDTGDHIHHIPICRYASETADVSADR